MKKSEMIKIMMKTSESFKGQIMTPFEDFNYRLCEALLACVEDVGMLPPGIETDEIIHPNGTPEYRFVFDWEPEEEDSVGDILNAPEYHVSGDGMIKYCDFCIDKCENPECGRIPRKSNDKEN